MKLTEMRINKNNIVNIVIILVALLVLINIYKVQANNIKLLKEKIDKEKKKNVLLQDIVKTEEMMGSYKIEINRKDISSVINTLGIIANKSGVKISSVKPSTTEDFPVYIKYNFELRCETNSYHAIGKFISNLESYLDVFFINKLNIRREAVSRDSGQSEQRIKFNIDLSLNTIVIKG